MGCPQRHSRHRGGPVPDRQRDRPHLSPALPGARPSPNIWHHPEIYEIENRAFDRRGLVSAALASLGSWDSRDVLDIGCGTGFHLPFFAASARSVVGVEPMSELAAIARRRTRRLDNVSVLSGLASDLRVPAASIDFAHARWAYFFGPGCEPGLIELDRVMRRGGIACVIDNDPEESTFGRWFTAGFPEVGSQHAFWSRHGWSRKRVLTDWAFDSYDDLAAVVRIELPQAAAEAALAEHSGLIVDYAVNVWWREY